MADTLLTISTLSGDPYMRSRVAASAAQNGITDNPEGWSFQNAYVWAAAPGWAAAWDSAVASDVPNPGADQSVISDDQINAQVQAMLGPGNGGG